MLKNHIVLHGILVPIEKTFLHVVGNGQDQSFLFGTFFPTVGNINHSFYVIAIKTIFWVVLWIFQPVGMFIEFLFGRNGKRGIHIQFKVRNNKELIPEHMLKIRYIAKVWV